MSKVYVSVTFSRITLALLFGMYLGAIYGLFKEKILNIYTLSLGDLGSFLGGVFSPILFMFIVNQYFSQQEQLLEARNKEKEKEEEKIRLAQPLFEFKNNYIEQTRDEYKEFTKIKFEFINHASDATNISISILPIEAKRPYYNKKLFKLSCNETGKILINFEYFDLDYFDIEVRYFDSLRLPNVKFYSCQKIQNDEYGTSFPFEVIEKK